MNILVVGNGGREHALAWKLAEPDTVERVYVAPGNAGTALEPKLANVPLDPMDIEGLVEFALEQDCALTVIGPEAPLVAGIVDVFAEHKLACFGPTAGAAQLEGSKSFTKHFLARHNIPTASYAVFTDIEPALAYIREQGVPIVIKADGLAAGKGVVVAMTLDEAEAAVRNMLGDHLFGEAGAQIVVEGFLEGEEASFIVMVDGVHVLPMATSQDHKRIGEGDTGPNTGGMGAYSPAPVVTDAVFAKVMERVILPTVQGMAAEGHPYTGFLYAGLMIDTEENPSVIEYNCRFGDPETQPIMHRLKSDLGALCLAALNGRLDEMTADWDPRPAVGVVLAAEGYPGSYDNGHEIKGLNAEWPATTKVFHAGTQQTGDIVVTQGGRVLCVSALGDSIADAITTAYAGVDRISWEGAVCRRDIGWRAIDR